MPEESDAIAGDTILTRKNRMNSEGEDVETLVKYEEDVVHRTFSGT